MSYQFDILAAIALEGLAGGPRWPLHPARAIEKGAAALEAATRRILPPRLSGIAVSTTVIGVAGLTTWAFLRAAESIHPLAGDIATVLVLWTTLAVRDVIDHAFEVEQTLAEPDPEAARRSLSHIVDQDTEKLDEPEVVRRAVESVVRSTVEGFIAPLLYASLLGPVSAVAYRTINILNTAYVCRNERADDFRWASALIDDIAGFIPARLAAFLIALAAVLSVLHPRRCLRIFIRNGRGRSGNNSRLVEEAFASALNIQLGRTNDYICQAPDQTTLGRSLLPLCRNHIGQAIRLMVCTAALATVVFLGIHFGAALLKSQV